MEVFFYVFIFRHENGLASLLSSRLPLLSCISSSRDRALNACCALMQAAAKAVGGGGSCASGVEAAFNFETELDVQQIIARYLAASFRLYVYTRHDTTACCWALQEMSGQNRVFVSNLVHIRPDSAAVCVVLVFSKSSCFLSLFSVWETYIPARYSLFFHLFSSFETLVLFLSIYVRT